MAIPTLVQNFSLFELVDSANVRNIFVDHPKMLAHRCRTMEGIVIDRELDAAVYVGFQTLDRLSPILKRYRTMATIARDIWIFGKPSLEFTPDPIFHVGYLQPQSVLAREWFLIVRHPSYMQALVAQEVSPEDAPTTERSFRGVIVTEPAIVELLAERLEQALRAA